ncbi:hypothetical protein GUITHDRAFT_89929 [Guillardia theta CCMP2712]|uniref:Profilin n=2 Tax=Guillardia theta TaxID=55529 RepID=L1ILY3_GUITC|nr:hypothetical protein GUITHDRAFT_89929 [Guillardia theta CCMP2712]EKX36790.1 hypothetical protein GUITHDRAFT_89929 [Guillardia theta CCMP2712]|eukprot:XP_005823770.1 hypothetical protein GUITHDRAFT_89929 [Guillardia theta CCMP2712]
MSWQAYVDDHLVGTRKVSHAAIIGLNGAIWASSANFKMSAQEGASIATAIAGSPNSVLGSDAMPVTLQGVKFLVLRADESSIYLRHGPEGACIAKTNQCILIGMYGENQQAGDCNVVVEKLADYLKENGY